MNVQINPEVAASSIASFVKEHGGEVKNCEVLELVAKIAGFKSYRALKATAKRDKTTAVSAPVSGPSAPASPVRLIEDEKHIVFRATAQDWRLNEHTKASFAEVPKKHRLNYDFTVEQFGPQFRVMMKPVGTHLDNFEGLPVLDMLLEINQGVPCAHMTNDPQDSMLLSVFASGEGLVVRPDDGEWLSANNPNIPKLMKDSIWDACDAHSIGNSYVSLMDTRKKYSAPVKAKEYPFAETLMQNPCDHDHIGGRIRVAFKDEPDGDKLRMTVELVDAEGVVGDNDYLRVSSSFSGNTPASDLKGFADSVAQLVEHFVSGGAALASMLKPMTQLAVSKKDPVIMAEQCLTAVLSQKTLNAAFETLHDLLAPQSEVSIQL